jgi:hypothetical protein
MLFRNTSPQRDQRRPNGRSRSNTAHSYNERFSTYEEEIPDLPVRPSIRSQGRVASSSRLDTRLDAHDEYPQIESPQRPNFGRSSTFQGPTAIYRESAPNSRKNSVPADVGAARANLRPSNRINTGNDVFGDPSDDSTLNSGSPDRSYGERSVSPATSQGSVASRNASYSTLAPATNANGRKGPPPPPPSRAKKPAPPPPPMKRAEISSNSVNRY